MQREIVWVPWDAPGMEHLVLRLADEGSVEAESTVLGVTAGGPFTVHYRIACDASWRVRRVVAEVPQGRTRIDFRSDGYGIWTDPDGAIVDKLKGCVDVDISATPFTNTLPILRLQLEPGETREIAVLYVDVPSLEVSVERQRYTCLERDRRFRFESVDGGFTAELPVDRDGLVLDYPGLFRRVNLEQVQSR